MLHSSNPLQTNIHLHSVRNLSSYLTENMEHVAYENWSFNFVYRSVYVRTLCAVCAKTLSFVMWHRMACMSTNWALMLRVCKHYSGTGKLGTERSSLSGRDKILAYRPKAFDYLVVWLYDFFGLNRRSAIGAKITGWRNEVIIGGSLIVQGNLYCSSEFVSGRGLWDSSIN